MASVAIVEDDQSLAETLREYIGSVDFDVSVYNSAEEAIAGIARDNLPDAVLMDISLPGICGVECTRLLKEKYPDIEIIMYSISDSSHNISRAIDAGASGYILKEEAVNLEIVRDAVNAVMNGKSYLSGRIAKRVLSLAKKRSNIMRIDPVYGLTAREEEILRYCLSEGYNDKQIAEKSGISVKTVNQHFSSIYKKMKVHSKTEAIAKIHKDNGLE